MNFFIRIMLQIFALCVLCFGLFLLFVPDYLSGGILLFLGLYLYLEMLV